MDEVAFPILLVDSLWREAPEVLHDLQRWWPMVKKAAGFLALNGPVTQQDRWEEDAGYSPFTLAVEIAGLVVAADLADSVGEPEIAAIPSRNRRRMERQRRALDLRGWRTGAANRSRGLLRPHRSARVRLRRIPISGFVAIKNRPPGHSVEPAVHLISPDALALVRFGVRAADDPRVVNTVKVIDSLLRVQLPQGPCWYRYNGDGYGEHEDGSPYDGTGIGRPWPLLAGERAHYELAAGRPRSAEELLQVMEYSTNGTRLIPEQVWDAGDIPSLELFKGKPSGSACPLVWAHSEYIKLRRSLRDGKIFDQPPQPVRRYVAEKHPSPYFLWSFTNKCRTIPLGKKLRLVLPAPALVHWSFDQWQTSFDTETRDSGLGTHLAELPAEQHSAAEELAFTLYWLNDRRWEGTDFLVMIEDR